MLNLCKKAFYLSTPYPPILGADRYAFFEQANLLTYNEQIPMLKKDGSFYQKLPSFPPMIVKFNRNAKSAIIC